jgi:hypothetical protein
MTPARDGQVQFVSIWPAPEAVELPLRRPQDRARIVAACEANEYPAFGPKLAAESKTVA